MQDFQLTFTEKEINPTAKRFLSIINEYRHVAFYGEMGSGKTTFIRELCKVLDTIDLVSSPTFAIINEYATRNGLYIYHFDFYRIKSSVELLDIGFNDYCTDNAYCFIEWPDKAKEIIPDNFLNVKLQVSENDSRTLSFTL
jgi:tRNA threonylcarbamoyladenosine biosynthesis protein TsaE